MDVEKEKGTVMSELDKKIKDSIRILKMGAQDKTVELSYSGGKDSDVILALAKMADISIRPIYKCTTIDPPGTIRHVRDNGVEVIRPEKTFFQLIEINGLPSRWARFCCRYLKEYKIMDDAIHGIRKVESIKRAKLYKEPLSCRMYHNGRVNQILPILEWTDDDVNEFIAAYGIKCHPLYYDEAGNFHVERRLGCIGCPLAHDIGLSELLKYPKFFRAELKAYQKWWNRPRKKPTKTHQKFNDIYEAVTCRLFFGDYGKFLTIRGGLFGSTDCKAFLEDYFKIDLTL